MTSATLEFANFAERGQPPLLPVLHVSLSRGSLGDIRRVDAALSHVRSGEVDTLALLLSGNSKALVAYLDLSDPDINAQARRWAKGLRVELVLRDGDQSTQGEVALHVDGMAQDALERLGTAPQGRHRMDVEAAIRHTPRLVHASMSDWCMLEVVKEVPVTRALLKLAAVVQAAHRLYQAETDLARELELPEPANAAQRCEDLFFDTLSSQRRAAGLTAHRNTLNALLRAPLAAEVTNTLPEDLAKRFTFHPRRGLWRSAAYAAALAATYAAALTA